MPTMNLLDELRATYASVQRTPDIPWEYIEEVGDDHFRQTLTALDAHVEELMEELNTIQVILTNKLMTVEEMYGVDGLESLRDLFFTIMQGWRLQETGKAWLEIQRVTEV